MSKHADRAEPRESPSGRLRSGINPVPVPASERPAEGDDEPGDEPDARFGDLEEAFFAEGTASVGPLGAIAPSSLSELAPELCSLLPNPDVIARRARLRRAVAGVVAGAAALGVAAAVRAATAPPPSFPAAVTAAGTATITAAGAPQADLDDRPAPRAARSAGGRE